MQLAFERVGSGEPLVLVHGVGHRRQAWYPVLDQLAEQREVVLVDLPGHGESDPLVTDGRPMVDVLQTGVQGVPRRAATRSPAHGGQFPRRPYSAGGRCRGRRP